ncbi:hypothetical protein [Curtobacterium sp. MCBA15_001]|uniref:hypothetical protein n=1 Tax=Curtobacterium sp. MCBA15_001 TaxID=1898731 RepID=UPI0008DE5881|nr:hypothetical protein [Curtobacterium sp. MCBA15_001]OIH97905.1 hypothetical protein BIU90_12860 [Curtobacterium sp. MCBA15_001]
MSHTSVKKEQSNSTEQNNKENPMNATATVPTATKPAESKQEEKVNSKPQAATAPQKAQEKPRNTAVKPEQKQERQQATVTARVAPEAVQKPQEPKEDTLNLSQVAALTGRSYAGVNASAEKLAAAGANTSGKGKEWKVTRSHLVQVGWLDAQGKPVAPQRGRGASNPRMAEATTPSALSIPELVLAAELAEQVASEKKAEAAEASAAARAARRAVEEAVQNAEAEFKQAEANLAAARSIMEEKKS